MENTTNFLPELDENGQNKIDVDYYRNVITEYITEYIDTANIDRNKITGNDLLSIFSQIQEKIFKPLKPTFTNKKCDIPYTQYNITELLKIYVNICLVYKVHPSLFSFSILTGITEEIVKKYVTASSLTILNYRREMLRNDLASDRMGRIVLANNDSSYGLEYEKKNTIERETVRQGLALNDLPKLE